mmetsp:Transcript_26566/g.67630  ORF Transcript_26566/g.67630 Transcript_26566/m.67630 type:complete len:382 (+) Transcript_26566:1532-2677(+)
MAQQLGARGAQLHQRGRVRQRLGQQAQPARGVSQPVVVLRQVVQHPHARLRRLGPVARARVTRQRGEAAARGQCGRVPLQQLAQSARLARVAVQRAHVAEERGHTLAQVLAHVRVSRRRERGALQEVQGDAAARAAAGVRRAQLLVQRGELGHLLRAQALAALRLEPQHAVQRVMPLGVVGVGRDERAVRGLRLRLAPGQARQDACAQLRRARAILDLGRARVQHAQRALQVAALLQHARLVQHHLAVLVRLRRGHLAQRALVRGQHLRRHVVRAVGVVRERKRDPVVAVVGLERQQLLPRVHEAGQVAHLDLQQRQVPQDLHVVLVQPQCVEVALDGLAVVTVRAVQQAIHMPAHMTPQVCLQPTTHEVVSFLLALGSHV